MPLQQTTLKVGHTLKPIRLILFDIDGTLVHTRGLGRAAMREAMLELFGDCGPIDTHQFGGKTDWQTLTELLGCDDAHVVAHMPAFEASLERHIERLAGGFDVVACPFAIETVEALRQRDDIVLGLVTGNVSTSTPVKLRAAGFSPADFVIGAYGSEAFDGNHLPPLALKRASDYLGETITPDEVMVVGDTLADIECARALGAKVTAVATGFSPVDTLRAAQPDYFIHDLRTFLSLPGIAL